MTETNPYRPPTILSAQDSNLSELKFDGEIMERDYVDLIPHNLTLVWLLRILLVLLIPLSVMALVFAIFVIGDEGVASGGPKAAVFMGTIGLMLFATVRTLGARHRARRQLKHHPDVLGPARGTFGKNGLEIADGMLSHWFSPKALAKASVSNRGIRIPVDAAPYRYLALTARLFEHYDVKSALALKQHWSESSLITDEGNGWESQAFDPEHGPPWAPETDSTAVHFAGTLTTQTPLKSPALRSKAIAETFATVVAMLLAIFFGGNLTILIAFGVLLLIAAWSSFHYWRQYFVGMNTQTWHQVGWVDDKVLAVRNEIYGSRCNWDQVIGVNVTPELVTIAGANKVITYVPRNQVSSEADWNRLTRAGLGCVPKVASEKGVRSQ